MTSVISGDGTTIAVETVGSGPPLVLVVGAFCNRTTTRPLAALLADRFTVHAYDRRGRGDSSDTAPYTVAKEYDDLAAVCEYAGGKPGLYGHSSGAILAAGALTAGVAAARLVLHEPPWSDGDNEGRSAAMARDIADAVKAGRPGDGAAIFLGAAGMPPEALAGMRNSPDWGHFERLAPTLPYDLAQTGDNGVPVAQLTGLDLPTLVLVGGDSAPFFATVAGQAASALPQATLRTLAGQGHAFDHAVLAPILAEFFA